MSPLPRSSTRKNLKTSHYPKVYSSPIMGDGEMAELVRRFDWASTPLGPVESWSDTLLTTVNMLLASRHPMFLWWGPDLIQFYNDGYRPSIRADKHPRALGQRGMDCWPEIWAIIGPQIDAVMQRGSSTWNTNQLVPINRNGKLEEVFWTYSYSPVRDKDGIVQGTLVVCSETTEPVLSLRRQHALLSITPELEERGLAESHPLLPFAQIMVRKLEGDPADVPFAALYFMTQGASLLAGSTDSIGDLGDPDNWPLAEVLNSQAPRLLEELQQRFGEIIVLPWPEPVSRAYLLPIDLPGSTMQAVMVFGISPRLAFDNSYQTFFQMVGSRIAGLLQSEIHQMERAHAARRFSRLTEANPFGMVIGNLRGDLEYVNPAFLQTLGYSEAEVRAGKVRWDNLTPPEYREADARAVRQLQASGRCDVYEKAYIAKDGRRIPILIGASIIEPLAREPEVAAFVTDLTLLKSAEEALRRANDELEKKVAQRTAALEGEISERQRAEMSLRELTGRLLRAQDEERRHMARELHDHAGQTLTALTLNLSALYQAVDELDAKSLSLVADSQQLSEALSKEIRTLSYLLHPPLLDEVGLGSALRWYVEGFSKRSGIRVELDLPADVGRLARDLELVIFRVVQESLTNIHRHSESATAQIVMRRTGDAVKLEVCDQGKGMSAERKKEMTAARAGVGVRGMEERVRQFGGTLHIASSDQGTKVVVLLPLTPDRE